MKTAVFPGRYVQGPGALAHFGEEVSRLGKKVMVLVDRTLPRPVMASLTFNGTLQDCDPACTERTICAAVEVAQREKVDVLAAMGGGKMIDQGRAAADRLNIPFVSVPTVAASDAPTSSLAVIYDEDGKVVRDHFVKRNPNLVIVDSTVIASAPVRFFSAGIGDALATFYEADACRRAGAKNMCGGHGTLLAHAAATLCRDTVLAHGAKAVAECEAGAPGEAFEAVLEANILLSGIGFESGGVAAAHAIHHGIAELAASHGALHGEKVAFGVLGELVLNSVPDEEVLTMARFNRSVRLPATLAELGLTDHLDEAVQIIAKRATREGEIIYNEPIPVDAALVAEAIRHADALGQRA